MWAFHNGLETPHSYAAHPLGWIVQWRPTSFFYPTEVSGLTGQAAQDACGATSCSQAIVALGNPVLWWCAAAAIIVAVVWLFRYRDWRAGAVLSGIVAGWLPWFAYAHRTIFTFYSIVFTPWVVLTLVYVIGLVVGPKDLDPRGRRWAIIGCGVLVGPDRAGQRVLLPDLVRVGGAVRLLARAHVAADLDLTRGRSARPVDLRARGTSDSPSRSQNGAWPGDAGAEVVPVAPLRRGPGDLGDRGQPRQQHLRERRQVAQRLGPDGRLDADDRLRRARPR